MMTTTRPRWAERVDSILHFKERNRSWLARQIGIDISQLSRMMNGIANETGTRTRYPLTQPIKEGICKALEIPQSELFSDD